MKKHIPSALFVLLCTSLTATAQEIMVFEMKDSTAHEFNVEDIRRIIFRSKEELPNDSTVYLSCPDDHHPHLIDLGLPSGTKWACCNVGAHKPEGSGGYYAWGEVEEKDDYEWETYQFVDYDTEECVYIADDISGSEYDVAHVLWGGAWRMPTLTEITELEDSNYTTCEWTQVNGVYGCRIVSIVKGFEGNSIFLPAAGQCRGSEVRDTGEQGLYWGSSIRDITDDSTYPSGDCMRLSDDYYSKGAAARWRGYSIRPVVSLDAIQ